MSRRRSCLSAAVALGLIVLACQSESLQPGPNHAPTARIGGGSLAGPEGSVISFDGSGSTDPDGDTLTYAWVSGDGERVAGTGAVAGYAYRDEGTYTASLIVSDPRGAMDTATTQVVVTNAPPVVTFFVLPSSAVELGSEARVSVGFTDAGASDVLTAELNWGDQRTSQLGNSSSTLNHLYDDVGSYVLTLTVRDSDGGITTKTATTPIVVSPHVNHAPIARIEGPSSLREGAYPNPLFSARLSTDPDSGDALTYTWLSGDGRTFSGSAGTRDQGWNYPDNGTYTVSVIVTDPDGAADTASAPLTVINVPPTVEIITPPQQAIGISASTRFAVSDSGGNDQHTVAVRWGDGTSESIVADSIQGWNTTASHAYARPGSYVVEATVRDDDGGEALGRATYSTIVIDPAARRSVAGYDVVDLGTLGGNSAKPADINDRGQIVGQSLAESGTAHAFLWQGGAIQDLGTLGHGTSEAHRISESGLIAGEVWRRQDGDEGAAAATIWSGGNGRTIEDFRPWGTSAIAIAGSGTILWTRWGYESHFGYVWRNENWQALKSSEARGNDMNEKGQIVGIYATHSWGESRMFHAFLWEADSIRDLGVLSHAGGWCDFDDCSTAAATDINARGQIVGLSNDSVGALHFVLWEGNTMRDLGAVPTTTNYGWPVNVFINDAGAIAASAAGTSVFWKNGSWRPMGSLGGGTAVVAMNEAGEVVGTSMTANGEQHVFVWSEARGMVDLGTGPHAFTAAWATGINARGDVIGYAAPCRMSFGWPFCDYPQETRAVVWRKQ